MPTTIYHLALLREWDDALASGAYRRSTLGRSLDDVGFVHCATAEQVDGVADRYYAEVDEPLVLLEIDTARVGDVRWEDAGTGELFPHVYGPLPVVAVAAVRPYAAIRPNRDHSDDRGDQGPGTRAVVQE